MLNIRKKLNNNFTSIPPLTDFNSTAYIDKDKGEMLSETYTDQFSFNPYLANSDRISLVNNTV